MSLPALIGSVDIEPILAALNLAATAGMTGLIWLVQLVHYPAFANVSGEDFIYFHRKHTRNITYIVFPLMCTELILAGWFLWDKGMILILAVNALLVALLWGSTVFIQIPLHGKLSTGKDLEVIRRLCITNWWRTGLWTVKTALAIWLIL